MKKFIRIIKEKWLKETSLTIVLVALILVVFLGLNLVFNALDLAPLDFTQQKIYSLSDESKNEIKKVQQNVTLYFFGYSESDTTVVLGKQYQDINDKITTKIVSTSERPDLATTYGVSSTDKLVAVSSSQRYKVIDSNDMYTYDTTTYQTIDVTEQKLTNAILDVTIVSKPKVYFLTGHEEIDTTSSGALYKLSQYIVNDVNDVSTLDLLSSDMPEKCDLLIVASPKKDFTEIETNKILNYINNGGKIMWLQDPYITVDGYNPDNFANINRVLAEYGISFSKGLVCETSEENMISGYPDLIIPKLTYNSIVKDIYTDGKIIVPDAGKIVNESDEKMKELNVTSEVFVSTSKDAYYKENFDALVGTKKADGDETGEFIIGETLTKKIDDEKSSVLVAFSNSYFASNYQIQLYNTVSTPIELRNNKDILLNTVAFLTNRDDSIRIRKDTGVVNFQTATASQDKVVKIIIFTVPVIIIIAGIVIAIIRKRMK